MSDLAPFLRRAVALSLVLAPLLMLAAGALQPPFVESHVDRLADVEAQGAAAWASNVLFIATQVPMLVAFLGLGALLHPRAPRSAVVVMVLGVLATFSEATMGGTGLVYLTVAPDEANRTLFGGVWEGRSPPP